jgi:hemerythrin-like domain-containing protein
MKAIEVLMGEHREIEKALDDLEAFVKGTANDSVKDGRTELKKYVEFIREFADHHHHGKEEDILFAEMNHAGFPKEAGPLAVMCSEHEEGRRQVKILKELSERSSPWTREERSRVAEAALGYTELLRQHIQKEDHVLYPMAESRLSSETWSRIEKRFEEFEKKGYLPPHVKTFLGRTR